MRGKWGIIFFKIKIGDILCSLPIQGYALKIPINKGSNLPNVRNSLVDDINKAYSCHR
eukprot:UN10389